jgi:hypothetical protein
MATAYGTLVTSLVRTFLVDEGLCDQRRATELAQRFDRQLRGCESIETDDGTTFTRTRRSGSGSSFGARQLGF